MTTALPPRRPWPICSTRPAGHRPWVAGPSSSPGATRPGCSGLALVVTRSGRRVGGPKTGEPDQGQHDHRSDVRGVSTSGMLIRLDVFESLGGFDRAFGQFRDDLDFCWRAQLAGHRVVVAPRARMREAAALTNGQRSPDVSAGAARRSDRRHGRQVALARSPADLTLTTTSRYASFATRWVLPCRAGP